MAGFGFLVLAVAITLSLIFPAPLGQPGVAGAEVTKPWWMFVWLFPAEGLWGVRGLVAVPAMLGLLLASVPILDRSPYLSPQRRRWILIGSAIVLGVIVISGIYAELQPVTNHLGLGGM